MAQVYKFRVELKELEKYIWREIEITSVSSVAKLGYAILAAFGAAASHLFFIEYNGVHYEFMFEEFDDFDRKAVNPSTLKLSKLFLSINDYLAMCYDYGAGWEFNIKLIEISEMKKGSGTHYPYITNGEGKGIIENTNPSILLEYIEQINKTGELPTYYNFDVDKEMTWDYRNLDLKNFNGLYKFYISQIEDAFEGEYYE